MLVTLDSVKDKIFDYVIVGEYLAPTPLTSDTIALQEVAHLD